MNDSAIFGMLGLLIGGAGGFMLGLVVLRRHLAIAIEALDAHSRLSDAHNSTKERIERALECETPGANATVKRMARILKGEQ